MRKFNWKFFDDFSFIEGEGVLDRHLVKGGPYTVQGAIEWFKTVDKEATCNYVIYGNGGINRWYVTPRGEVMFSDSHCYQQGVVETVRDKGYKII